MDKIGENVLFFALCGHIETKYSVLHILVDIVYCSDYT